ncbi:MAG: sugar ABC transporter permease [Lachnospiraceae bacterium]|nr:sugar ABC transporter permease [Lachnospiraceae bacterium]
MEKKKKNKLTLERRNQLKGLVFVLPFIIGVLLFFLYPILFSLRISIASGIKVVGMKLSGWTFEQYKRAFVVDTSFLPEFKDTVIFTLTRFPLTIILSLIIAILLNKDIKGRGLFRVIFFIPFLLGSGEVMQQIVNQGVARAVLNVQDGRIIPYNVLMYFGNSVMNTVQGVFGSLVTILWGSGVQILLFLAGLQSISPSLYEAAKIDGATEWEIFWKVTIPMISPMMLLNIVYTLVDSFTSVDNKLLTYIRSYGFTNMEFSYAAAMSWLYFLFIALVVAIVFGIMKKYMHTNEIEEVRKRERKHRVFTIEKAPRRTFE